MKEYNPKKKYTITLSEEQLRLMANAIEDWSRFMTGQCEMFNATCLIEPTDAMFDVRKKLGEIEPYLTPDLPRGASYGWSGSQCKNEAQRKAIAMSYGIYRQILHYLATVYEWNNVYSSPTLTCKEQGGLIEVKEVGE